MNSISFFKALLMKEIDEELKGGQKKLDVAEPKGKLTKADFEKLGNMKKEVDTPSTPSTYSGTTPKGLGPIVDMEEGEDHEVSMAHNSLESIIKSAMELKAKLGDDEKDIPAWIQDHITNAENYINQASKNYHEYSGGESDMDELPVGNEEEPVADMSLQGIMEDLKKSKLKEFGPSIANVSKEHFNVQDVLNWFTKKYKADELMHGLPRQFKSFVESINKYGGESGYIPANILFHLIENHVSEITPAAQKSSEVWDAEDKAQNKHARDLYRAIRSELKMYDRKGNPIN